MKTRVLMRLYILIVLIALISCTDKKEYLIQVPEQTRITSEWILSELEEKAKEEPENNWLLNQQLYFCEQMEWPLRCERVLLRARQKWGLSERLIDQFVAFYSRQNSYEELESILSGAIETRARLEAQVQISLNKSPTDASSLEKYLQRFRDVQACEIAINGYLLLNDSIQVISYIEQLVSLDPSSRLLRKYYPLLNEMGKPELSLKIVRQLLSDEPNDKTVQFDLAKNLYEFKRKDTAMIVLRNLNTPKGNELMHDWFKLANQWDSALIYLDKVPGIEDDRNLLLSKAKTLENGGSITRSLPFYEAVLNMDTTDLEMKQRVEIVRRKVAYLRQIREKQDIPPPPKIERKTLGN